MAFLTFTRAAALTTAVVLLLVRPGALAEQAAEHDVKAAYLFNFTKFVTWPSGPARDGEPFRVCVVADHRTTEAVERMMRGESIGTRPIQTIEPRSPADARSCQILFVSRTARDRGAPLLAAVSTLPVLTVGDTAGFIARGGAIQFVLDDDRVRFDINPANARAGLSISSRLLRVARRVEEQAR